MREMGTAPQDWSPSFYDLIFVELLLDCPDIKVIINIIIITINIIIIIVVFSIIIILLGLGSEQQTQCHRGASVGLPGHRRQLPGQDGKHPLACCCRSELVMIMITVMTIMMMMMMMTMIATVPSAITVDMTICHI